MKEKQVFKICLTGGPCSGKTTSLSKIREYFSSEFKVYTIPEIATMTFSSGVTIIPSEFTPSDHKTFTQGICQMQIDIEKYFETIASTQRKKVIIVTDRGVMDNFAFCSKENKEKILQDNGWTLNYLCNERYDIVLHLVTTAIGADEFYNLENNEARSQDKEQSARLDGLLLEQWKDHPNLRIIDNSPGGFERKLQRILSCVGALLGTKIQTRVSRKFLLDKDYKPEDLPKDLIYSQYSEVQTYLVTNRPNYVNWLTKRVIKDNLYPNFVYTSRILEVKNERRIETSIILNEKLYYNFLAQKDSSHLDVHKEIIQFNAKLNDHYGLCLIENVRVNGSNYQFLKIIDDIEFDVRKFIPSFLKVIDDVTENSNYFPFNMSKKHNEDQITI